MLNRTSKHLRYFIVILAFVVSFQFGLSLYTLFYSKRLTTPGTSNVDSFIEELPTELELENEKALTTMQALATLLSNETYVTKEPKWELFGHKTTLITNKTCPHYYRLLIIVSSAPGNTERRKNIRKTWSFESAFQPRWTTVFLVAQTRIQSESDSLLEEEEVYGDLVRADYYDHYWNQTYKIQMGFEWAIKHCNFSFLLKTDDDVFVNTADLISFLSKPTTPKKELYTGNHYKNPWVHRDGKWKVTEEEYSGEMYPDFCPGFGYVLSYDVVVSFVKAFDVLPYFRLDDVYVGMLADITGVKIIHNDGFELDSPRQCVPNEGTLVRHGFYDKIGTHEDCLMEIFNRARITESLILFDDQLTTARPNTETVILKTEFVQTSSLAFNNVSPRLSRPFIACISPLFVLFLYRH